MIKVSIVILNWNRKKDSLECLESISKSSISNGSTSSPLSIIVVDNASTDDSRTEIKKALKRLTFKNKNFDGEIIKNKENLGFAAGNNVGVRHALNHGADYILILNNDTVVGKNLIVNLVNFAIKHPRVGIMSPKIYFAPGFEFHKERYKTSQLGKVIWYAGGDIDWNNIYGSNHGVDEVDRGQFDEVKQTDFATGAGMFAKAEALRETGLFDEKYYMYLEDADLSQRMKKKGWEVLYVPTACIWHKVAQSSKIGGSLNDYFIIRNRLLFGIRYATLRVRFALYRESLRIILNGSGWQRRGAIDFYLRRFGKGSWRSS